MESSPNLSGLRLALLQDPADSESWASLIDLIEAMGGGLLLSDLDPLFEQPLVPVEAVTAGLWSKVLQQGLNAHRAGDAQGLRRAWLELQHVEPEEAWVHALEGLLAEMEGCSGYAAFARALAHNPSEPWFRYWLSVASLRRRDWIDFSCHALLLDSSETLEHQVLVLAATYHLIAAALAQLAPDLCHDNDLRVFDLVHPDAIPHSCDEMVTCVLRFVDKERRKMIRILISLLRQETRLVVAQRMPLHQLLELLRWRVIGLAEPGFSADLYDVSQRQLDHLPPQSRSDGGLQDLLPRRPDLIFGDEHVRIWRDFRFILPGPQ